MMVGAVNKETIGLITPPYAAKLISGLGSRATKALKIGMAEFINTQLSAKGHHVRKICLMLNCAEGAGFTIGTDCAMTILTSIARADHPLFMFRKGSETSDGKSVRRVSCSDACRGVYLH